MFIRVRVKVGFGIRVRDDTIRFDLVMSWLKTSVRVAVNSSPRVRVRAEFTWGLETD